MNGDIGLMGFWIGGVAQAHRNIGAGVFFSIRRRRQQLAQIEIGIARQVDHLLADRCALGHHRRYRILHRILQQMPQFSRFTLEEMADALAGAIQANRHADIFKAFDFVEDHDRAIFAGRTLAGPAGAYVTIDAGEFSMRVDFGIGFNILAGKRFQQFQRGA